MGDAWCGSCSVWGLCYLGLALHGSYGLGVLRYVGVTACRGYGV